VRVEGECRADGPAAHDLEARAIDQAQRFAPRRPERPFRSTMKIFVYPTDVNDFQERIEERLGCFEAKTSLSESSVIAFVKAQTLLEKGGIILSEPRSISDPGIP
jgi:hypothetical protein